MSIPFEDKKPAQKNNPGENGPSVDKGGKYSPPIGEIVDKAEIL